MTREELERQWRTDARPRVRRVYFDPAAQEDEIYIGQGGKIVLRATFPPAPKEPADG